MSVLFQLRGDDSVIRFLRSYPEAIQDVIVRKWQALATTVSDRIKEKLSGEVLQARTGRLRASIVSRMYVGKSHITLSVGSRGDVPYAGLQEYGGTVRVPEIYPSKMRALMFYVGGAKVYARRTVAHVVVIPERSYIRSTMDEMIPVFSDAVIDSAIEARESLR